VCRCDRLIGGIGVVAVGAVLLLGAVLFAWCAVCAGDGSAAMWYRRWKCVC
jgi:hypothetical protein